MSRFDSPHDKLIKEAFGSVEAMRGLLGGALPKALVEELDLATLAPLPGSFVDQELTAFHGDLLFSVSLRARPALVYILIEHKSRNDRWVLLQLLRYSVRIWERFLRDQPRAERLPPIIPLVVCHDPTGWSAPRRFADLLDPAASELPDLARLTPHFEAVVDDLTLVTDDELWSRAMGRFATLAAIFLRDARTPDRIIPMFHRIASVLGELLRGPDGSRAFTLLLSYLSVVTDEDVHQVTQVVLETVPEAKDLVMTIAEQLRQQGLQKGIQQGRQEGRQEMRLAALRRVLELRFGALDPGLTARLEAAQDDELDRLFDRAVTAASLEEVIGAR